MAIEMGFVIEVDNVNKAIKNASETVDAALEICGGKAETYAKKKCPVGTPESTGIKGYIGGTLRNSITHQMGESGKHIVYIGSNVEYAPYVELGTSRNKRAQPYLRPAIEEHLDEYRAIINAALSGS